MSKLAWRSPPVLDACALTSAGGDDEGWLLMLQQGRMHVLCHDTCARVLQQPLLRVNRRVQRVFP